MTYQEIIQQYAALQAQVLHTRHRGRPVPPQVLDRITFIENKARASFTPQEQHAAMQAVEVLVPQYSQMIGLRESQTEANRAAQHRDQVASQMTGMDMSQVQTVATTGKMLEKGSRINPEKNKAKINQLVTHLGLNYDSLKKLTRRVEEIELNGGDANDYLKQKFGGNADHARKVIDAYTINGMDMAVELVERRGYQEDYSRPASEDEIRRAQIFKAFQENAGTDSSTREALTERINPELLSEEGSRGDVARAMLKVEMDSEPDGADYTPYDYSEAVTNYEGHSNESI